MTRQRFRISLAAVVASIVVALGWGAPANAALIHGCGDSGFCLYEWVNYGRDRWQASISYIYRWPGACMNISPTKWADGQPVNDNSGSMVINSNADNFPWNYYTLYVYNWANCNPDAGVRGFPLDRAHALYDLSQYTYTNFPTRSLYRNITSVSVLPSP